MQSVYLLDTHVLIWVIASPKKLSKRVKQILSDSPEEAFVSIISIWEISLKFSLGKIEFHGNEPSEIPGALRDMDFKLLNLDADAAADFYRLPRYNKDPFDRMLVWQAIRGNFVLLSKDKGFSAYKTHGLKAVW